MRFCSHVSCFLEGLLMVKERLLFRDRCTDVPLQKTFFSRQMYKISRFCLNMPDACFLSKLLRCMFPLGCQRLFGWLNLLQRSKIEYITASIYAVAAELMDRTEFNLILWPPNYLRYLLSTFFPHNCHFNISTETDPLQK